jgi:hypothetical protein
MMIKFEDEDQKFRDIIDNIDEARFASLSGVCHLVDGKDWVHLVNVIEKTLNRYPPADARELADQIGNKCINISGALCEYDSGVAAALITAFVEEKRSYVFVCSECKKQFGADSFFDGRKCFEKHLDENGNCQLNWVNLYKGKINHLTAELARYRKAVGEILSITESLSASSKDYDQGYNDCLEQCQAIARIAGEGEHEDK